MLLDDVKRHSNNTVSRLRALHIAVSASCEKPSRDNKALGKSKPCCESITWLSCIAFDLHMISSMLNVLR